jgi:hypothetical protein
MISEQIERLRKIADTGFSERGMARELFDAADTIEELSAKLANANMERSTAYYNDGWIPVGSGKLPEEKENPVTRDWYVYPVMVRFEEITDIRYYSYGNGHWYHGPGIMDKYVTHWMDIKPYKPKGENNA